MPHYHLFQTDFEGRFLSGATFLLEDDEAAFAKARELCRDCHVEVWREEHKLTVIRNEDLPPGNTFARHAPPPSP